jgi:hypothetical protein
MKKNILQITTILILLAGLMNVGIGVGVLSVYYIFDIPFQIETIENRVNSFELNVLDKTVILLENTSSTIDSMTFPQELIGNTNATLSSIISVLNVSIEQMMDISNSFYHQAEMFWDLSILWDSPEVMREMGDVINELHLSIDMIIPALQTTKNNITDISSSLALADVEVEYFQTVFSSMLRQFAEEVNMLTEQIKSSKDLLLRNISSFQIITPVVYLVSIYFIVQGVALMSISIVRKYDKTKKTE